MKRTAILLLAALVLFGCATAPTVTKEKLAVLFYPPLPDEPRLQLLKTISNEDDIGARSGGGLDEFLFGKSLTAKGLNKPWSIAASKGKIYVMDRAFNKVIIIDLVAKKFDYIEDERLGKLYKPVGLWVTPDDTKYVADVDRKQVVAFGPDNQYLTAYGSKRLLSNPVSVAVRGQSVYVADMDKNTVLVFDKETGKLVRTIGEPGAGEGQLYKPTHVVVDADGNIFVNSAFSFTINKYDPEGRFLQSYGSLGDTPGSLARPKGIGVDQEGHLYVADAAFNNTQIFNAQTGQLMLILGGLGTTPDTMYLPGGVFIDYDNLDYFQQFVDKDFRLKYLVYVGNLLGPVKINVFGFGQWIGPPLITGEDGAEVKKDSEAKKTE